MLTAVGHTLRGLFAALGLADAKPTTSSVSAGEEQRASALVAESVAGWHVLTIDRYSTVKAAVGTGKCVRTRPFTVGGHLWYVNYFPNNEDQSTADYISIYLMSVQDAAGSGDVSAWFRFVLLDHNDHDAESVPWQGFHNSEPHTWKADGTSVRGHRMFVHSKRQLERSAAYLRDDCVRIRCDVVVVVSKEISTTAERDDGGVSGPGLVVVPPPDVGLDILQLLWDGEGSDVTFEVAGERILAHRYILAARSPVFMAELYGPMKETTETCVRIDDMEAGVFRLLLHFLYTDWLPEVDEGHMVVMSQHLLVAADRYDLERLKLICEHNLCCRVNASTVATTLALAEQHGCQCLKKACVQFLKSSRNMKAAMATEGFEHLTSSCPNVLEELLAMAGPD